MDPTVGKAKTAFAGKGNRGKWGIERSICLKVWRCFFVLICFNTKSISVFVFIVSLFSFSTSFVSASDPKGVLDKITDNRA